MVDACRESPLAFLGDPLPRWVNRTAVTIEAGGVRQYVEAEWRDALVIVEQGEVALECTRNGFTTFRAGDVLWLVDVPVRRMHNHGDEPTVIVAISRMGRRDRGTGTDSDENRSNHMSTTKPTTELDQRFSSEGVPTTSWAEARQHLAAAEIFWISTVRPDGRPHVTPLMTVLIGDSLFFCTGATEQKAMNIEHNRHVALTTGGNTISQGLDLVVEGQAVRTTDEHTLRAAADLYKSKYGWTFEARDGILYSDDGGDALLFEVKPARGFGFGKGEESFSQTRWTFAAGPDD